MRYEVDATINLDTFKVVLHIDGQLKKDDTVFQFAATAPGTYQTMNIGRFVSGFTAFDAKGNSLDVDRKSINQFVFDNPKEIATIRYQVAETFDTPVKQFRIYLMCGSSIEADHAFVNPHTVLGYFSNHQKAPFEIKVIGADDWQAGSALSRNEAGDFLADSYDHAVDSPILLGDLFYADTTIENTRVEVYTYSTTKKMKSEEILDHMSDMLDATSKFLVDLPVDRYTFLYFFEPDLYRGTGAWEHSYSSSYVLAEDNPTPEVMSRVIDIASHEFFHIVAPLNIHSEIIESFNFEKPTSSVHLWMYEGVTEWASNILLYRGGVVDLFEYLNNGVADKIRIDEKYFDPSWSLKKMAEESFNGGKGAQQYGNVYQRGALVAGLLDIRLLQLSKGTYGLRELILDLIKKYGKGNPVSEETFFNDITEMTYPEIREFFDRYVLDAQPLPVASYYKSLGLILERTESGIPLLKKEANPTAKQQELFTAWSQNLPVK